MSAAKRFLFFAISILACSAVAHAFPSEDEVKSKLRLGLTTAEVFSLFGEPDIGAVGCVDCNFKYAAPVNNLTVEKEGYVGVSIRFVNGRVHDWHFLTGYPSYAPFRMPLYAWRLLWLFPVVMGLGLVLKLIIRWTPVAAAVSDEVAQSFENRDIQPEDLPTEFRFISHETTVEEVIEKLGVPSRTVKIPISAEHGLGYALVSSGTSDAVIVTFEYDLPYHAAVIVMPEFPFERQSRIRAVFYRPIQPELADATEQ